MMVCESRASFGFSIQKKKSSGLCCLSFIAVHRVTNLNYADKQRQPDDPNKMKCQLSAGGTENRKPLLQQVISAEEGTAKKQITQHAVQEK